jgi:uncharacterized protein YjbI with pentapeptide repeats
MLFESIVFDADEPLPELGEDHVFRYCTFLPRQNLSLSVIYGVFLGCTFQGLDFYWAIFNNALVANSTFDGCTFGGASFHSSQFIECSLKNCAFEADAFGKQCDLQESRWYSCLQQRCTGIDAALIPYDSGV